MACYSGRGLLRACSTPHVDLKDQEKAVWLLSHSSTEVLAKKLGFRCQQHIDMGLVIDDTQPYSISNIGVERRRSKVCIWRRYIEWKSFNDGFPNIFIREVKAMAGKDVIFLASFHEPAVIFEQLSVLYQIPKQMAKSLTVILPYFPTGTMERVDNEGQVVTAKTLATMLSAIPLTASGPPRLLIFDIHNLAERFYFSENIIPRLESAIPLLKRVIKQMPADESDNVAIAFPDDGAFKRFHSLFPREEVEDRMVTCAKVRGQGDKRTVTIRDGNPSGRHCIIVDDLVQTGGTLLKCAEALHAAGAAKVSAYVTHAVFPRMSWRQFCPATDDDDAGTESVCCSGSPIDGASEVATDAHTNDTSDVAGGAAHTHTAVNRTGGHVTDGVSAVNGKGGAAAKSKGVDAIASKSGVRFEKFWITDSLPHAVEIAMHEPFELLSLCDVLADILLGFDLVRDD